MSRKTTTLVMLLTFLFLVVGSSVAQAADIETPDSDKNVKILKQVKSALKNVSVPGFRKTFVFTGKGASKASKAIARNAGRSGSIVFSVDATPKELNALFPESGNADSSVDMPANSMVVSWCAYQANDRLASGSIILSSPLKSEELTTGIKNVYETLAGDQQRHDEAEANLHSDVVVQTSLASTGSLRYSRQLAVQAKWNPLAGYTVQYAAISGLRDVRTVYPPDVGSSYAVIHVVGKVGRAVDIDMLWTDGSNYYDYWFLTTLDQVIPGKYAWGSQYYSEEYRHKYIVNDGYQDIQVVAPPDTEPGRSWNVGFGFPTGLNFTASGTLQEMRIYNNSQLFNNPDFVWLRYDFTAKGAAITNKPYSFNTYWKQVNTQNKGINLSSYQTYVTGPSSGISFGGWVITQSKPGY